MIEVNLVCIQGWIRLLVRIPAIDPEGLDMAAVALGRPVLAFSDLEFAGSVNSDISGLSWFDDDSLLSVYPTR
jgi:hypothetical protein